MPSNESRLAPLARRAAALANYQFALRATERGTVLSIGDGIALIAGAPSAGLDEILALEDGSRALVFSLDQEVLGAILLEQSPGLTAGLSARLTGRRLALPVGESLLGRVIDPLGKPLDGEAPPQCTAERELDGPSPPIVARDFVAEPLATGNKIVDTLIPIGKGQRQLLIGDNGLGKSTLALDAVVNQRGQDVLCVYVMVGQKRSSVASTLATLRATDALAYTVLVVAEATTTPGLKYLAPFAGCAVAEWWMQQGKDTLIVYDDLTTHAQAYRELSLLLRRPPGREAYPADIFYLHSRLLEHSTRLAKNRGGGSMTALPIVETQGGELAAYIPTNLISITDGQIYFDAALYSAGVLPAIDVRRSVSRIGGAAQHPRVKEEAGRMKLDYLQFLELEVFTRFGATLETSMATRLKRGRVLRELLKQDRLASVPVGTHVAWLIAFNSGMLDELTPPDVARAMALLAQAAPGAGLELGAPRETWQQAIRGWLAPLATAPSP